MHKTRVRTHYIVTAIASRHRAIVGPFPRGAIFHERPQQLRFRERP